MRDLRCRGRRAAPDGPIVHQTRAKLKPRGVQSAQPRPASGGVGPGLEAEPWAPRLRPPHAARGRRARAVHRSAAAGRAT
jgi:hypothetical protein